jgi:hypothetical protein
MKQETIEEAAENRFGTDMDSIRGSKVYDLNTDLKRGFIQGAKWMGKQMENIDTGILLRTTLIIIMYWNYNFRIPSP